MKNHEACILFKLNTRRRMHVKHTFHGLCSHLLLLNFLLVIDSWSHYILLKSRVLHPGPTSQFDVWTSSAHLMFEHFISPLLDGFCDLYAVCSVIIVGIGWGPCDGRRWSIWSSTGVFVECWLFFKEILALQSLHGWHVGISLLGQLERVAFFSRISVKDQHLRKIIGSYIPHPSTNNSTSWPMLLWQMIMTKVYHQFSTDSYFFPVCCFPLPRRWHHSAALLTPVKVYGNIYNYIKNHLCSVFIRKKNLKYI